MPHKFQMWVPDDEWLDWHARAKADGRPVAAWVRQQVRLAMAREKISRALDVHHAVPFDAQRDVLLSVALAELREAFPPAPEPAALDRTDDETPGR